MHDPRVLLDPTVDAVRRLARRGYHLDTTALESLSVRRNTSIKTVDDLRAESKRIAKSGPDGRDRGRELKELIRAGEQEQGQAEDALREVLLGIPNLPDDSIPDGATEDAAALVRTWGDIPDFGFEPVDHVALGEQAGILDFQRAAKLSGARFTVARGAGAALERALASFFLAMHTTRHGYLEHSVPYLVLPAALEGTGQLPKFAGDLFATTDGLYLIPTAEVPLTNLHAGEIIDPGVLPLAYTAWTPCFRSEAGSHGKDTRGLIRVHQFAKVELVRIVAAERSAAELEILVGHAEAVLQALELPHRTVLLAAGDTGFSARKTYDVEVWLPGQGRYREISSCSDCGTFQARRANIRTRTGDGKREFVATLNGSGLPIGRTMAAILENGQQADGSVVLPAALAPFAGFTAISPDGAPVS